MIYLARRGAGPPPRDGKRGGFNGDDHLPKERLFLVPGNHDVDGKRIGFLARTAAPSLNTPDAINGLLGDAAAQQRHEYLGHDGQLFRTQQVVEYQEETRSHEAPTYDHTGAIGTWAPSALPPGQALRKPVPLFKKMTSKQPPEELHQISPRSARNLNIIVVLCGSVAGCS